MMDEEKSNDGVGWCMQSRKSERQTEKEYRLIISTDRRWTICGVKAVLNGLIGVNVDHIERVK